MVIHMLSQRLPPESNTGAPLQALALAKSLHQAGHEVVMHSTRQSEDNPRGEVHCEFPVRYDGVIPVAGTISLQRLWIGSNLHRQTSAAQIVHAHSLSPFVMGYALRRAGDSPALLVKPSLGGGHQEGELRRMRKAVPRRLIDRLLRAVDMFLALDHVIYDELLSIGVSSEHILKIDNGIDLESFTPASDTEVAELRRRSGYDIDEQILLYLGQLTVRKGVEPLLDAWCSRTPKSEKQRLLIVGQGPLTEQVRALAESREDVTFINKPDDVASIIRLSSVLILPSAIESFGNVVIEALACGKPVAATRTGVSPRVLNAQTGWLLPDNTVESLSTWLNDEFVNANSKDPERCVTAAAGFGFEQTARAYIEIYEWLLSEKTPSRRERPEPWAW